MIKQNQKEIIKKTYDFLEHQNPSEVRILSNKFMEKDGKDICYNTPLFSGYIKNIDELIELCDKYNSKGNIYIGIRDRKPAIKKPADRNDIISIKTIVVDLDPVREKGTPATWEEVKKALHLGHKIQEDFKKAGFIRPISAMSGNGCQLWFAIPEIKITNDNREKLEAKLSKFETLIRLRYQTDEVSIDSIYDYPRIIKLIGTTSVKGEYQINRPHRDSYFINEPVRKEDERLLEFIQSQSVRKKQKSNEYSFSSNYKAKLPDNIKYCDPMKRLLQKGYTDRSLSLLIVSNVLLSYNLDLNIIANYLLKYDEKIIQKLTLRRDGEKYITNMINRTLDYYSKKESKKIPYPCHMLGNGKNGIKYCTCDKKNCEFIKNFYKREC